MEAIEEFVFRVGAYYGRGDSSGAGYKSGNGEGNGFGSGNYELYYDGYGYDFFEKNGIGKGLGQGSGYNNGTGRGTYLEGGVKSINGEKVYMINNIPTIIKSVRGNIAKGFILQEDLTLSLCYIAKENRIFTHGNTIRSALAALQKRMYFDLTRNERISKFKEHFNDFTKKYPASDLFVWHHILARDKKKTCDLFCLKHGIDLEKDSFTLYEFIEITKKSYGGEFIKKLLNL